jgi:hypothetical protein
MEKSMNENTETVDIPLIDNNLDNSDKSDSFGLVPELTIKQIQEITKQPRYSVYVVIPKPYDSSNTMFGSFYVTGNESPIDYVLIYLNITRTERDYLESRGYQLFITENPRSLFVSYNDLNISEIQLTSSIGFQYLDHKSLFNFFGYNFKTKVEYGTNEMKILKEFWSSVFYTEEYFHYAKINVILISNPNYAILRENSIPSDIETQLISSGVLDVISLSWHNTGKAALQRKLDKLQIKNNSADNTYQRYGLSNFFGQQFAAPNMCMHKLKIAKKRKNKNNDKLGFKHALTDTIQRDILYETRKIIFGFTRSNTIQQMKLYRLLEIMLKRSNLHPKLVKIVTEENRIGNLRNIHGYLKIYRNIVSNILNDPLPVKTELFRFIKEMVVYIMYSFHFYRTTYTIKNGRKIIKIHLSRIFRLSSLRTYENLPVFCMAHLIIIHSLFKTTDHFIDSLLELHSYDVEFCNDLKRVKTLMHKHKISGSDDVKKFVNFYKNKLHLIRSR